MPCRCGPRESRPAPGRLSGVLFSSVFPGDALGVPSPREGARALCPAPLPHPTFQEEEDSVPGGRACPARQPPAERQPALHPIPRQRQQLEQHGELVSQAQYQANTGTASPPRSSSWRVQGPADASQRDEVSPRFSEGLQNAPMFCSNRQETLRSDLLFTGLAEYASHPGPRVEREGPWARGFAFLGVEGGGLGFLGFVLHW